MTLFHDVNQLKTAGWDKGCSQFQHRGCVVLQSPAISLFTEVKAVSCSVPGASIPVQWLMQACTGTLCCLSIQCMKSCSWAANSHHQLSSSKKEPSPLLICFRSTFGVKVWFGWRAVVQPRSFKLAGGRYKEPLEVYLTVQVRCLTLISDLRQ